MLLVGCETVAPTQPTGFGEGPPAGDSYLKASTPVPVSPKNGLFLLRGPVTLVAANAANAANPEQDVPFEYEFQVFERRSDGSGAPAATGVAAQMPGRTRYVVESELAEATDLRWRVRAVWQDVAGEWSPWALFVSPGFRRGATIHAPFTTGGGRAANLVHVVERVAAEHPDAFRNSCQEEHGTWEFMDRVVEALRLIDGRWGYNCKRGNCAHVSVDVVNYYRGSGTTLDDARGSTHVQVFDIIVNHCNPNPRPAWTDLTESTRRNNTIGRWKYPR